VPFALKFLSNVLFFLALLAWALAPAAWAQAGTAPGTAPAMPVKAVAVKVGTVKTEVSAVGNLIADEAVVLRPEIAGRVTGIHFTEGQPVAAGARLVSLDAAEFHALLAGSTAEVKLNTQRYERAQELRKQNFISQQALDEARENLAQSIARQRQNEVRLAKTEIRAPFAGTVGLRQVSPGAYVQAGQDIARLDKIDSLKLDFRVPELFLAKIRRDQEVSLELDAYPGERFSGRLYAIEPGIDPQTRTVLLRARIPNVASQLRPGMFVRVNLVVESRSDALIIPEQAVVPSGQATSVYRVVDGKAVLTKVELGSRQPGQVEVIKGLSTHDTVVTDGQIKLRDGSPVSVMDPSPPAAKPSGKGT